MRVTLNASSGNVVVIQTAATAAQAAAGGVDGGGAAGEQGVIGREMGSSSGIGIRGMEDVDLQMGAGAIPANGSEGAVAGPMLVGTVVAPAGQMAEAMVASWGVEDVAKRLQEGVSK